MEFILETLAKVGFDWRMGVFNFVNFMVVFFILRHFAFGPILRVIEDRQKKMKDGLDNYEKSKSELMMAERKAQELVDDAKVEANRVLEKSHDEAKEIADDMKASARKEIEGLISQAKTRIAKDRSEMKESLRKETAELVVAATEKVLGSTIDKKQNDELIKGSLEEVSA